jgi:ATP-dependent RNA helicase DeaD
MIPQCQERGKIARLFINLGKISKINPGDIVGAIAGETGIPGDLIGSIEIYDKFSFVEVPKREAEKVIDVMNRSMIKGKAVNFEVAKSKDRY